MVEISRLRPVNVSQLEKGAGVLVAPEREAQDIAQARVISNYHRGGVVHVRMEEDYALHGMDLKRGDQVELPKGFVYQLE